ncbi:MAG: ABC transporter permease, partial [Muribaculaceae bacterium]|nr:ABC transporter permease [Muribaculaceae bacterium]
MNYPLFIARRLSLSSGGKRKAPAVAVAVAAVALSVAVMLASIAIVLGFKSEIREKVVGFNGHITLYASPLTQDEDNIITNIPSLRKILNEIPYITDYSLQAAIPAILKTSSDFKGIYLKGLNGELSTKFIEKNLEEGKLIDLNLGANKNKIYISRKAARQLKLKTGDKIDTYFISDDVRVRRLEIAGIFNTHFDQYDDLYVLGSLPLVQQLGQIGSDQGTFLCITTDNFNKISDYTLDLQKRLNKALAEGDLFRLYRTDNVLNQGAGFFSWLNLLDTNVVVVLILMMIVGCVTLVSGMLIIILEKKRFIGMMKALGAPTYQVRKIFIYLALRIAITGLVIGNVIMLTLLYLQSEKHFIPLDPESYYIDFVPVELTWQSILILN